MMLSSDGNSLAEGKTIILYILNKIGKPVTNDALLNIVTTLTDMNYFYFQQFLLDLIEEKYIVYYQKETEKLYEITKEGEQTLKLIGDIIPGITKLRIDMNLKENLDKLKEDISVTADFIPHSENDYSVKCKITENNTTLFALEVFAGSREQAKSIVDNWTENAVELYPQIWNLIIK